MSWSLSFLLFAGIPVQHHLEFKGDYFQNYHRAHRIARESQKPLLMILDNQVDAANSPVSLSAVRKTSERRELLKNYVVVVIDVNTPHGKVVHKAYSKPKLPHVVVLDKSQRYQIFTTSETLYGQRWTEILKTHREGNRVVRRAVHRVAAAYCNT